MQLLYNTRGSCDPMDSEENGSLKEKSYTKKTSYLPNGWWSYSNNSLEAL